MERENSIQKPIESDVPTSEQEVLSQQVDSLTENTENEPTKLSPEVHERIMEKVRLIGRQKNLMGHTTLVDSLPFIAKYGIVAHEPKFAERWKNFEQYKDERYQAVGRAAMDESGQGIQSISMLDPWCWKELSDNFNEGKDYNFYAYPINLRRVSGYSETTVSPKFEKIDQMSEKYNKLAEIIQTDLPCKIEEINGVFSPGQGHTPGGTNPHLRDIIHGKFIIPHEYLYWKMPIEYQDKQQLEKEVSECLQNLSWSSKKLLYRLFYRYVDDFTFKISYLNHFDDAKLVEIATKRWEMFKLYKYVEQRDDLDAEIKQSLQNLIQVHKKFLPSTKKQEKVHQKGDSLEPDKNIISSLRYGPLGRTEPWKYDNKEVAWASLLVLPTEGDFRNGKIVRNASALSYQYIETYWESRIPKNRIIGIMYPEDEKFADVVTSAQALEVPIYDPSGNLIWPESISLEDLLQRELMKS